MGFLNECWAAGPSCALGHVRRALSLLHGPPTGFHRLAGQDRHGGDRDGCERAGGRHLLFRWPHRSGRAGSHRRRRT
eukprot:7888305-Pyramimonas_sp.AAC.1